MTSLIQFYLVAMGRGDEYDARTKARAAGVSASFSLNGMNAAGCSAGSTPGSLPGGMHTAAAAAAASENLENSGNLPEPDDQPVDLYRENEELKVFGSYSNETHVLVHESLSGRMVKRPTRETGQLIGGETCNDRRGSGSLLSFFGWTPGRSIGGRSGRGSLSLERPQPGKQSLVDATC